VKVLLATERDDTYNVVISAAALAVVGINNITVVSPILFGASVTVVVVVPAVKVIAVSDVLLVLPCMT
jgi:hypothetical protein